MIRRILHALFGMSAPAVAPTGEDFSRVYPWMDENGRVSKDIPKAIAWDEDFRKAVMAIRRSPDFGQCLYCNQHIGAHAKEYDATGRVIVRAVCPAPAPYQRTPAREGHEL